MNIALQEEAAITYIPKFREHGIDILDGGSGMLVIRYCPWCGTQLPASLRRQWFEKLDVLGLEPESDAVPAEMRTEAWWRTDSTYNTEVGTTIAESNDSVAL